MTLPALGILTGAALAALSLAVAWAPCTRRLALCASVSLLASAAACGLGAPWWGAWAAGWCGWWVARRQPVEAP